MPTNAEALVAAARPTRPRVVHYAARDACIIGGGQRTLTSPHQFFPKTAPAYGCRYMQDLERFRGSLDGPLERTRAYVAVRFRMPSRR